jgi:hypothetical protein
MPYLLYNLPCCEVSMYDVKGIQLVILQKLNDHVW